MLLLDRMIGAQRLLESSAYMGITFEYAACRHSYKVKSLSIASTIATLLAADDIWRLSRHHLRTFAKGQCLLAALRNKCKSCLLGYYSVPVELSSALFMIREHKHYLISPSFESHHPISAYPQQIDGTSFHYIVSLLDYNTRFG